MASKPRKRAAKTAGKTAAGRPFVTGDDPRRGVGKPGRSGRPKDVVRLACRRAFDTRIPILTKIADGVLADVSPGDRIRALDCLARYGGMVYGEVDARMDTRVSATVGVVETRMQLPENGRGVGERDAALAELSRLGLLTDEGMELFAAREPAVIPATLDANPATRDARDARDAAEDARTQVLSCCGRAFTASGNASGPARRLRGRAALFKPETYAIIVVMIVPCLHRSLASGSIPPGSEPICSTLWRRSCSSEQSSWAFSYTDGQRPRGDYFCMGVRQ